MKPAEVHNMKDDELVEQTSRLRMQLFELRSQSVTEQLENPSKLSKLRRDIARLLTEQRERQLNQEPAR